MGSDAAVVGGIRREVRARRPTVRFGLISSSRCVPSPLREERRHRLVTASVEAVVSFDGLEAPVRDGAHKTALRFSRTNDFSAAIACSHLATLGHRRAPVHSPCRIATVEGKRETRAKIRKGARRGKTPLRQSGARRSYDGG